MYDLITHECDKRESSSPRLPLASGAVLEGFLARHSGRFIKMWKQRYVLLYNDRIELKKDQSVRTTAALEGTRAVSLLSRVCFPP